MREILVINALNERDLLRDRIFQQIGKMRFVDYKKPMRRTHCRDADGRKSVLRKSKE